MATSADTKPVAPVATATAPIAAAPMAAWSVAVASVAVAAAVVATVVIVGQDSQQSQIGPSGGGVSAKGSPAPVAGAGLPVLLIAGGYALVRHYRNRRKADQSNSLTN